MYCCNQDQCPKPEKQDGKTCYCDAVPFGMCSPEYSDSYCETYNNNPYGPVPLNREQSIRASCCSSVNYAKKKEDCCSCPSQNRQQGSSSNFNPNGRQQQDNVLQWDEVYKGFNEDVYANRKDDPCCKQQQNKPGNRYCCGNVGPNE